MAVGDPYFRVAGPPADLELLPRELREHEDVPAIAAHAEYDTLAEFTRDRYVDGATTLDAGTVVERYVWLRGYSTDPDLAPAALAQALRREIAGVIRWRIAQFERKPNVESESAGEPATTKAYRDDAEQRLPPEFGRALRLFELGRGTTAWVI